MSENNWSDEPSDEEMRQLDALLANPDLWSEPDLADEDAIVATILAEKAKAETAETASTVLAAPPPTFDPQPEASNVVPISRSRRWVTPALSAAAGLVLALIGVAAFNAFANRTDGDVVELALQGTELAPGAEATASIVDLPAGTRVELEVSELAPAAPGTYYEVWLRQDAEVGVSAGTFHLRGGDSDVELWAGVSLDDYPLVTITIQDEADPTSSGRVVLKGLFATG